MLVKGYPTNSAGDWMAGAFTTGQVGINWFNGSQNSALVTTGTITTGSWNHLIIQGNTAGYVNMFINGQIQTLTAYNYSGSGTSVALNGTVTTAFGPLITVGQFNNVTPNFAIAKARILFGANTYTTTSFTPSPNLGAIPAGGTVAWSLDSQYPLPTYPSIQDVTPIPSQLTSYGAVPTPIGGVTSNTLGPYSTTYPQLDSIRFDGTGYIDYGNAASSVLTTNLWANAWTIEGWVYPTTVTGVQVIWARSTTSYSTTDFGFYLNGVSPGAQIGPTPSYVSGTSAFAVNTWYHVAWTHDGTNSNIYVNGSLNVSQSLAGVIRSFNPTGGIQIGNWLPANQPFTGNLADVRVSNVARYTGTTYVVPSAPFVTDANTLLLLKSLAGQTGTTLEVQGRGLNAVSLGATRSVQSYPPAPMSSYLLDTTSNASVTYGQGKYIASASSEEDQRDASRAFDFQTGAGRFWRSNVSSANYQTSSPYGYTGSVRTVDTLGNSYAGEWIQLQLPVSVLLQSYNLQTDPTYNSSTFYVLGSRDGINWTLVNSQSGITTSLTTFVVGATQAYNYFRLVTNVLGGSGGSILIRILSFSGTEESLCISNDAKVGVGIANPQRALEVAGDLVVSGTISGGAGLGSFRNRIINGDMRIAQRGTSAVMTGSSYLADRFLCQVPTVSSGTAGFTYTVNALSASDTPYQLGLSNSITYTCTNGLQPSVLTGSYPQIFQGIEGYNIADLNWGTSFGSPVTVSFWFKSNVPSGSIMPFMISGTANWYVATFTYNTVSTWQYVTFSVPPPPNGSTWSRDNTVGINLLMFAVAPASLQTSTPNTWGTTSVRTATNCYPWIQNAGNFIQVTGVQLEKGTVATGFEFRPFAQELALCQRYYYQVSGGGNFAVLGTGFATSATAVIGTVPIPPMRASPSTFFCSQGSAAYPNGTIIQGTTASNNDIYGYFAGSNFNFTTVSASPGALVPPGTRAATIQLSGGAGGLTAGWAGALVIPSTAGKYWAISAEL
jgi:hypothetical protein